MNAATRKERAANRRLAIECCAVSSDRFDIEQPWIDGPYVFATDVARAVRIDAQRVARLPTSPPDKRVRRRPDLERLVFRLWNWGGRFRPLPKIAARPRGATEARRIIVQGVTIDRDLLHAFAKIPDMRCKATDDFETLLLKWPGGRGALSDCDPMFVRVE